MNSSFHQFDRCIRFFRVKKNDKLKLCVNYRDLNKMTKKKSIFFIIDYSNIESIERFAVFYQNQFQKR